nr:60S ribosomal protein L29-like [Vicugna pacos]
MCFAKKHKRGQKKMQADNAKATSARAEAVKALGKPKEVKPKIPQGSSHELSRPACTAHPKPGKRALARIAKQLRLCWPKAKAKAQPRSQLQLRLRLQKAPKPPQRLQTAPQTQEEEQGRPAAGRTGAVLKR